MEDMYSILEQTRESIDGQIEIYASLLNYLTYSPEIQEVIFNKDMDRYTAYEQYTEVVDPLLTVRNPTTKQFRGYSFLQKAFPCAMNIPWPRFQRWMGNGGVTN